MRDHADIVATLAAPTKPAWSTSTSYVTFSASGRSWSGSWKPFRPAFPRTALPEQTSRAVLDALQEAAQPLATRELTLRTTTVRDLDAEDRNLFLTLQKRVLASLRNLWMRGKVRSDRLNGSNLR